MSNQTFYFILFLGIGLIASVIILMRRSAAAGRKNVALAKKLSDTENQNAVLQEELAMFQRRL